MKTKHKSEIERQPRKKIHKRKRTLITLVIGVLLLASIATAWGFASQKSQVRMLLGTMHFASKTLEDPSYLAYGVDLMELIHDYVNADVKVTGKAGVPSTDRLNISSMMNITMVRSFSQKRMATQSDMSLLWMNSGKVEMYAEDQTVYLYAPMIAEDFGYAFPTGIDLFMRMPDLTSDVNQAWFSDHWGDIVTLMSEIGMEELMTDYVDENGLSCDCYRVTIPKGSGHFIWELLGMDDPDYDVITTIWLNSKNQFAKIYIDLSDVLPGAEITVIGTSVGKAIFTYQLPENEWVECIMERNPNRFEWIDVTAHYYANNGEIYNVTCGLHWEEQDEGFLIQVKEAEASLGDKVIATGYFKGKVEKLTETPNVFGDREQQLYGFEILDWRAVRDDVDGFAQLLTDRMLGKPVKEDESTALEAEADEGAEDTNE